jgi:SSS family solute:Na+ symporter
MVAYASFVLFAFISVIWKREAVTAEGYSVGNRGFSAVALFLTIAATMIGPSASIGAVEKVSTEGFFYVLLFCMLPVQLFVFGEFFVEKLHHLGRDCRTIGDIIGKTYGKLAQFFTGLATLGQSMAFSGVLCLGGAKVLDAIYGVPIEVGTIGIAVFTAFYTMVGGLPAVIKTDKIQFFGLVILLLLAFIALPSMPHGSFSKTDWFMLSSRAMSSPDILALGVAFGLGEAFIPIYAVRGIIGVNGRTVRLAFVAAAIFGVTWFLVLGVFGLSYTANIGGPSQSGIVLLDYVLYPFRDEVVRALIKGSFAVALMGIVMSTFDSVLSAGSVSVSRDLIRPFVPVTDEDEFTISKVSVLAIAVFGVGFTLFSKDIVEILFWGYTFWAPTIVAPLGYLIYKSGRVRWPYSGPSAMICGAIGSFLGQAYVFPVVQIPPIITGFIISCIALALCEGMGTVLPRSMHSKFSRP